MWLVSTVLYAILCLQLQASAAPTDEQVPPMEFFVMNLTAKAETLSHRVEYNFIVQTSPSAAPVQCSALQTNLNESLTNVSTTSCGPEGSGVSFSWRQFGDGHAELMLQRSNVSKTRQQPPVREVGLHTIARAEITEVAAGTQFEHQVYMGPMNFTVPVIRVQ